MRRKILLVAVFAALLPAVAGAWGFDAHRRLTKELHEPLPEGCLKAFIRAKQSFAFQDASCDPDRWRESDTNEWPRHFLQSDRANPPADYPREYTDAVALFGSEYNARRNGQVPWRVEEKYGHLVEAFRSLDEARVLNEIAYLSHYVTDAFSPLHDSQTTDAKISSDDTDGMHRRYETLMFIGTGVLTGVMEEAKQYYGTVGRADPRHRLFDIILTGQPLAGEIAQADRDTQGSASALLARTRGFTARRFGDSLTLLSSLVASAWVDAGSPKLASMAGSCDAQVPQGELVLLGHPLPKPETEEPIDEEEDPPPPPVTPDPGSGCSSLEGAMALPASLLLAFALRRRKTRGPPTE